MIDRASIFSNPEIVTLLKTRFVPVAIDQWYQRRQQDNEGKFYQKIANQGPRKVGQGTTQGLYAADAGGMLLGFTNNRGVDRVQAMMKSALAKFRPPAQAAALDRGKPEARFSPQPPPGGLIVRVHSKVLGGYEDTEDATRRIFQESLGRDNLWISAAEHAALAKGELPEALLRRIARFHLVDNTRGEPPMWEAGEVRAVQGALRGGVLRATVKLQSAKGDRGFDAELYGVVETKGGKVTRMDWVAKGEFFGEGTYTGNAPKGKFPLGISFTLADGKDAADAIPPQASRGWIQGYMP